MPKRRLTGYQLFVHIHCKGDLKATAKKWRALTKTQKELWTRKASTMKGGFLGSVLAGVASPLIYDYAVKPGINYLRGKGVKKTQGGLLYQHPRRR